MSISTFSQHISFYTAEVIIPKFKLVIAVAGEPGPSGTSGPGQETLHYEANYVRAINKN